MDFEVFRAVCGSALCFMRKLPLIPQPIWQTSLLPPPFPSPLQTLLPPGCNSNLYVNEREKGVDGKKQHLQPCLSGLAFFI